MIDLYAIGARNRGGYRIIERKPAEIDHNGRYWCVRPSGWPTVIYVPCFGQARRVVAAIEEVHR